MYLRLLIFPPAILIPAYASSSPAFLIMYSAYKLNKHGDKYAALTYSFSYLETVYCSMSSSNCCFLTCIGTYANKMIIFEYHVCSYALSLLTVSPHSPCFLLDHLGNLSEPIKEAQQLGSPLSFFSCPKPKG